MLADSSGTPDNICSSSTPGTQPAQQRLAHDNFKAMLEMLICLLICVPDPELTPDLATGPAVVASPGEGELAGTDHTHGGAEVRDPDGSFRTQWSIISGDFLRLHGIENMHKILNVFLKH